MRVCIVGAGPRGTGVLQRLGALSRGRELEVHVVDPYPAGAGRIWRRDQPHLLWMNSPVSTVDMFDGPGGLPSLLDWVTGRDPADLGDHALVAEADRITGGRFASRPLAGSYFEWVFDRAAAGTHDVHVHRDRVVDVRDDGRSQAVWLAGRERPITADVVVLAQGHVGVVQGTPERELTAHARRHGLLYRPPGHAAPLGDDELAPGADVLLRGMGLTFVDHVALLTEGRGGRFRRAADGGLEYLPSGREPVLYAGSRRGVPYHSKPGSALVAGPPPLPHHLRPDTLPSGELNFRRDVWPLVVTEILAGYYHELFLGHPECTAMPWDEFSARLADSSADRQALIAAAVPVRSDRYHLDRVIRPMSGLRFAGRRDLQGWMRSYLRADMARRRDPRHSAELGAVAAVNSTLGVVLELVAEGRIEPESRVRDVDGWFLPLGSYLTSGPPARRLEELVALSEAGVVRFIGPDPHFWATDHGFAAAGPALPELYRASAMIDARLPESRLLGTTDPLLAALRDRGECRPDDLTGLLAARASDHRLLDAAGRAHPRRFAVGPCVAGVRSSIQSGTATGDGFFEVNDRVARTVLACGTG